MQRDAFEAPAWLRIRRQWPLLLAVAILVASVTAAVRAVTAATGGRFIYALDDAYIHMAVARNLAQHAVWGCTPFRFSSASSSPLWTIVVALAFLVTGVHDITPLVLNVVFGALTLGAANAVLRRLDAPALLRAATLVALVLVVPLPAMALLGMEHLLHLGLTIAFGGAAVLVLTDRTADPSVEGRHTWLIGLLAALLAASRYEGLFLVATVCAMCVALGQWRRGVIVGLAAAAPLVAFGVVSVANGSFLLPNSLMLKGGSDGASTWAALARPIEAADLAVLATDPPLFWLAVSGAAVAVVAAAHARSLRRVSVLLPLMLTLMVMLHVHFTLSSTFWVYRYDAYLLGFGVFVAAAACCEARPLACAGPRWAPGVLAAVMMLGSVSVLADVREGISAAREVESASLTYREHYQAARFVRDRRPGETVMVNDAGAMAYFSGANMLDIFGLCNVEPVKLRRALGAYGWVDVAAWTLPYRPSLAVVQMSWGWVVSRIPHDWLEVAEVELQPEGRKLGFFVPSHDPDAAQKLRTDVLHFYQPLAGPLGYRVRGF